MLCHVLDICYNIIDTYYYIQRKVQIDYQLVERVKLAESFEKESKGRVPKKNANYPLFVDKGGGGHQM